MYEVIAPPARLAPSQTLTAAAQGASTGGSRWEGGGVEFVTDCGEAVLSAVGRCDPSDAYTFGPFPVPTAVRARAFLAATARRCATLAVDSEVFSVRDRALAALDIDRHRQLEAEFWTGTEAVAAGWDLPDGAVAGQPYLASPDATIVDQSGLPVVHAFAELVQALAECGIGRGFVHVSRRAHVHLVDAGVIRREGSSWRDPADNIVVAGAGYDGSGPSGDPGEWMYATGPVEVRWGTPMVLGVDDVEIDRTINERVVRAQQYGGAWFDPCCHLAILTDLCASGCPTD